MTIVLWDIDGTLIRSGGAGKLAMETALRSVFGLRDILDTVPYSGRTDVAIGRDLLAVHGLPASDDNQHLLREAYLRELPVALKSAGGTVLPGILALLERFHRREGIVQGLLTGNVRRGAKTKLEHFGLWDFFRLGGFGDGHSDRDDVARSAIAAVKQHVGSVNPDEVWIIGDTPLDVKCARAVGAKAIAVATGWVSLEELKRCEPDYAFADLSDVPALLQLWS